MKALPIARQTVLMTIKSRLLFTVLALGLCGQAGLLLILSWGAKDLATDMASIGLWLVQWLGIVFGALLGAITVGGEIKDRSAYLVLTGPVSRGDYMVGRWLGCSVVLAAFLLLMGAVVQVVSWIAGAAGGQSAPIVFGALFLYILASSIIAAIAVAFSVYTTPLLSFVYTLALSLGFYFSQFIRYGAHTKKMLQFPLLRKFSQVIDEFVPDLSVFSVRNLVINGVSPGLEHYMLAVLYFILLTAMVLLLGYMVFSRKDLP